MEAIAAFVGFILGLIFKDPSSETNYYAGLVKFFVVWLLCILVLIALFILAGWLLENGVCLCNLS